MISRKEQHGDCTFVIVSDAGVNHRKNNIPNQDAVDFIVKDDDFALAVSDGVGSCIKAETGSKTAISAIENVFAVIKEKGLQIDLSAIANQIVRVWNELLAGERPDDCCATLKAAMKLGNKLLLFSVGDGLLAVTSGGMKICSPIKNDLFTNQTMCLNAAVKATDFWTSEFNLDTYVPYVVFACSDGVANGIQEGREMELVSEIETGTPEAELQNELETLLVDLSEYSSDDRTVGVVKYERKNAKSDR
jgi:serine/threonine protein phosphatase PrpC